MTKMTKRKTELLDMIDQSEPLSIYQLAQQSGRNYRRVHDHVQEFARAGLVQIRPEVRNGRQSSIVQSVYQQRLNRLNDMYAFGEDIRAA